MGSEQRRAPRRRLQVEVKLIDTRGEGEIFFDTHDLSEGGAFLKSDLLLEDGDPIALEVPLGDRRFIVAAKVVRTTKEVLAHSGAGMGIAFVDPPKEFLNALQQLLAAAG
jgi:hypothetical protein